MVSDESVSYHTPEVRDLAWAIGSNPLAVYRGQESHWPGARWFKSWYLSYRSELRKLDSDPQVFLEYLGDYKTKRLGYYFEKLISFRFHHDSRYNLLAENVQICDEGRTVGELDIVAEDTASRIIYHIETSVKFYAGEGNLRHQSSWIGSNRSDRMDIKIERLRGHQLPLSTTAIARQILEEKAIAVDTSLCILKGRMFYPLDGRRSNPLHSPRLHERGLHMPPGEFAGFAAGGSADEWRSVPRFRWLAPVDPSWCDEVFKPKDATDLIGTGFHPFCIAGFRRNAEITRILILPERWYTNRGEIR